jgi:hypothetical protein
LAGLAVLLIAGKIIYFDHFDNPLKHTFDGSNVTGAAVSRQVNFGDQINLLGYNLDHDTVESGQYLTLTAFWQARRPLLTSYSSLAQLVDTGQYLYAAQDNLHPGQMPSTRWHPWGFVQDPHAMLVPPGTPPGDYFLVIGLYDPASWARLPVLAGGDPDWVDVVAIPITVTQPPAPPEIEDLKIKWPQDFASAELRLLGATPERTVIRPNDFLRLALFWEALAPPTENYQVSVRLVNEDDSVVLAQTGQPSHNRYPTTHWGKGERVRDNHAVWIPPDFAVGTYRIELQVLHEAGKPHSDWIELGQLRTAE